MAGPSNRPGPSNPPGSSNAIDLSALLRQAAEESGGSLYGTIFLAAPQQGGGLLIAADGRRLRAGEALFDSLRPHGATAVRIAWRWEESSSLEILDAAVAGLQP